MEKLGFLHRLKHGLRSFFLGSGEQGDPQSEPSVSGSALPKTHLLRDELQEEKSANVLSRSDLLLKLTEIDSVDGVWEYDIVNNVSTVSDRWLEMFGYRREEVPKADVGQFWLDALHPDDKDHVLQAEGAHFRGDMATLKKVYRVRHKDGSYRWIHSHSMVAAHSPDGRPAKIIGSDTDVTTQRQRDEQLDYLSRHDELTSLVNRRQLLHQLNWEMGRCRRDSSKLAFVFVDLDNFKDVNDSLGHSRGDELLVEVARRLKVVLRQTDVVARLGGDEFALVLANAGPGDVLDQLLEKILVALTVTVPSQQGDLQISASMGVAFYPGDADDQDELLMRADQAMYHAKSLGRNTFAYYSSNMNEVAQRKRRLLGELRGALGRKEIYVLYQPIVSVADGSCFKSEALVRWLHPELGLISPADFIPLAEEVGVIHDIGEFVMSQALHDMQILRDSGHYGAQVSVNLSPLQIMSKDNRISWVDRALADQRSFAGLCVEITEGILLGRSQNVQDKLNGLRRLGVEIALDDFGTGYSSLSYLNTFAVDYLKIDRSFVSQIQQAQRSLALCEAMVAMAHKIDIRVVAEGVESAEVQHVLQKMGCEYVQGFHLGRPMPLAQLLEFMNQANNSYPKPQDAQDFIAVGL